MAELPYPLPRELVTDVEQLLLGVPDRGDTAFALRQHFGKVYALGYQDGRFVASRAREYWADREHEERQRAVTTTTETGCECDECKAGHA